MKFVVGENGRNPVKNLPRPRYVHHETHMEGPRRELETPAVGGERLTACATRPPNDNLCPGIGCVFFVCVLPCVVSVGGLFREVRPCVCV